jgi:two-component system sensor histidine kinase RpfC
MAPDAVIPTIMLSADATRETEDESRDSGIDAFLSKPVDTGLLLRTIADLAARMPTAELRQTAPPSAHEGAAGAFNQVAHETPRLGAVPDFGPGPGPRSREFLLDQRKLASLIGLGGGPGFLRMLLDGYHQDAEAAIAAVDRSLAARDYPRLHEALHALRGCAVEVGATAVVDVIDRLRALKTFELSEPYAQALLARLRRTQRLTQDALRARLEDSETAET